MSSLVPRLVLRLEDIEGLDCSIATSTGMFVPLGTGARQTQSMALPQQDGKPVPLFSRSDHECLERREKTGKREQRSTAAILHPSCRQRSNIIPRTLKIIVSTGREPPRHPGPHHPDQEELKGDAAIADPVADSLAHDEAASVDGNGVQRSRAVYGASSSITGDVYHVNARRFDRHCRRGRHQGYRQLAAYSSAPWEFSALDSLVSKGVVGSRVRAGEDGESFRHGVGEGLTTEARPRVKASSSAPPPRWTPMSLRSDLVDAPRVECQLYGRLKFVSSWAERLIREKNVSRKEIDTLRAKVRRLVSGGGTSRFSRTDEASMAMDAHHEDDEVQADTDAGGFNDSARGSASVCRNNSTTAISRSRICSQPLSHESGSERMVPMYTPSAFAHVSRPEAANPLRDRDGAEEAGELECSDRSGETEKRSSDPYEEYTDEDLDEGVDSVRGPCVSAESPAEVKRNNEEIFSSSKGKSCGQGVGLAKSGSTRRAQTLDKGDGIGTQSWKSYRRREDLRSRVELSNGDEYGDVSTRIRGKGESKPERRSVGQLGQQYGPGSPKKNSKRHVGDKEKRPNRKSMGSQTPPLRKTIVVNATENCLYPAETEEVLQTLAGLSTDMVRMKLAEEAKACRTKEPLRETRTVVKHGGLDQTVAEDDFQEQEALTDRPNGEVSATDGSWEPPSQCERCALLSEALQDSRGWVKILELLLLEQSRRTPLPQASMPPEQTNLGRPETNASTGDAVSATNVNNSTRSREFDQKEASDSARVKQENGREGAGCGGKETSEELLAAAEAVWRVSEMARDVLERELDRRGEALAAAKRAANEANEAFSKQLKELSDARATMQSQRAEVDKWKIEAEKSNAKERAARRALECARVAAGDAARRSEREAKVLRLETEDLRKKAFSLRTRLACAQGRHQTQLEMANKRIKQLEHNIGNHEFALVNRQQRQHHQGVGHLCETWCYATKLPPGRNFEGSGAPSRGKMGPPGDISRQRARRAFSCDAAALVSERSGVVPAGADSFASGRSLEHFPEDYNHYNEERKVPAAWVRSGSREKGVYAGGASYSGFIEDRFAVGDDNIVRGNSTAPAHSQPPASDWSPSTRIISTEGSEAGDRRSFAHASSGSRLRTPLLDPEFRASSRNGSQRTTPGRRASSAMSAVDGRDLWVKCFEKARRVSAPDYVERVAKLDRQADKDRVLRRASEYHRPLPPSLATESAPTDRIGGSIGSDSDRGDERVGEHRPSRQQDCLQAIDVATTRASCVEVEEKGDRDLKGTPDRGTTDIAAVEETSDEIVEQTIESPQQRN